MLSEDDGRTFDLIITSLLIFSTSSTKLLFA